MKKILLISGGIDSLTLYAQKQDILSEIIYFDYGQKFRDKELETLKSLEIPFKKVSLPDLKFDERMFFYGRNMHFMIKVREMFIDDNILVYFGNNADDNFMDNSREFFFRLEQLINNSYTNKTIRIVCPFESMTKEEVVEKNKEMFKEMTGYWCDGGKDEPCRECHSCDAMISAGLL